jgi:hypothetical protein
VLIQNSDHSSSRLVLPGETYESLGAGVFDVPEEVARTLTNFPHWSDFDGDPSRLHFGLLEPVETDEQKQEWEKLARETIAVGQEQERREQAGDWAPWTTPAQNGTDLPELIVVPVGDGPTPEFIVPTNSTATAPGPAPVKRAPRKRKA